MTTQSIKNSIYSEMVNGHSLLEAKLIVLRELSDKVDTATEELKTEILAQQQVDEMVEA